MDRRAVVDRLRRRRVDQERLLLNRIPVLENQLENLKRQNQAEEQQLRDDPQFSEERKMQVERDIDENHRQELDELREDLEKAEEKLRATINEFNSNTAFSATTLASRKSRAKHQHMLVESRFKARKLEVEIEKAEAVRGVIEEYRREIN